MLSGDYEGKDAVFGLFGLLAQETGGSFKNEIHDMLGNDDHVVALVNASAVRGGKTLDGNVVHILHLKDGKMTEFWSFPEDQVTFDEFWT